MMLASQSLTRKTGVLDHTVLRVSASEYEVRSAVLLLYTKDDPHSPQTETIRGTSICAVPVGTS
jgi:hypothetical protein